MLVYQILDAQKPVTLPGFRDALFIPGQVFVDLRTVEIKVHVFRIGAVVRHAGQRSQLVSAVTDRKPFICNPKMFGHAETQSVF